MIGPATTSFPNLASTKIERCRNYTFRAEPGTGEHPSSGAVRGRIPDLAARGRIGAPGIAARQAKASHGRMDQKFSELLRESTEPTWQRAVAHRFVEELFTGSVPEEVLRTYLVQDYQFVDRFVALLGGAVATADRAASRMALARQLGTVGGAENTYFQRSFDALGVPEADRTRPRLHPTTTAFNELMDEARGSGSYARCLSVLAVAEWLYLDWARRAPAELPENFVCREWIEIHRDPGFAEWVGWLRGELDRVGRELEGKQREACRALFTRATQLEADFFDAAYAQVVS